MITSTISLCIEEYWKNKVTVELCVIRLVSEEAHKKENFLNFLKDKDIRNYGTMKITFVQYRKFMMGPEQYKYTAMKNSGLLYETQDVNEICCTLKNGVCIALPL